MNKTKEPPRILVATKKRDLRRNGLFVSIVFSIGIITIFLCTRSWKLTMVYLGIPFFISMIPVFIIELISFRDFYYYHIPRPSTSIRKSIKEYYNLIYFSVQEWGIIVDSGIGKANVIEWWQIEEVYEDFEEYRILLRDFFLSIKPKNPKRRCIRVTAFSYSLSEIKEAILFFSKGSVPYLTAAENKKRKQEQRTKKKKK